MGGRDSTCPGLMPFLDYRQATMAVDHAGFPPHPGKISCSIVSTGEWNMGIESEAFSNCT